MNRHLRDDESGSILLAMLAIVTIGGMVLATLSLVQQSQLTTRRDRAYTHAIQVADAGVQQALTYLSTQTPASDTVTAADLGFDTTTDEGTFEWTAERDGFTWEVTATGTVNGVTRRIEALVERPARFFLAAFGDQFLTFRGGNVADSYNSSTCGALASCPNTGNGAVGSNGAITLNGNAEVDGVFLYGPGSSCTGGDCTDSDTEGGGSAEPIDVQDLHDVISAEANDPSVCNGVAGDGLYQSSTYAGTLTGGDTYCFSGMVFDTAVTTINATPDNPVTIYVFTDGILGDQNHQSVNMPVGPGAPQPGSLIINVLAGDVLLRNQSEYAFAVMAPLASCTKNGSNAQTDIYGSMVCGSVGNVGGWEFHFDDALLDSGIGTFDIVAWREEVGSTTSF